jgi:N-acetyl-anhydromuramyl-L-alanine amidase AmpD
MKEKILWAIPLFILCLITLIITISLGRAERVTAQLFPNQPKVETGNSNWEIPATCALKPETNRTTPSSSTAPISGPITLERFRRTDSNLNPSTGETTNPLSSTTTLTSYTPRESITLIHPTNYGQRYVLDLYSQPTKHDPIVVIHETAFSARSALNTFRTAHYRDADQVSYHTLIKLNGDIIYLVPPDLRAFGAGNSVFEGENGIETVKTHPDYPPSVNNFAYHVSLETPANGRNNRRRHGGYTLAQYKSLAWIVAKTGVPDSRITTHKAVDRSGLRGDPRSFDASTFFRYLQSFPRTQEIVIGCQPPSGDRT